jgi:APA family basic amino acid/polyamine antiporter
VLTASFEKLLIYIGFTLSITSLLTVVGLMRLRRKPGLTAKYRTFGYPVTPVLFITINLWIVVYCLATTPQAPIGGLLTIGLGLLFFQFFKRRKGV